LFVILAKPESPYLPLPLRLAGAYNLFERELEVLQVRYGFAVAGYILMLKHVHLQDKERANCPRIDPVLLQSRTTPRQRR
jgi:hypothetical protein